MGLEGKIMDNYDHMEPIPTKYGVAIVAMTMLTFQVINWFVSRMTLPENVARKDEWKYKNLFISWIHALIVGSWDISCFILFPEMMHDLIAYQNIYAYAMVAFSTGYFFYDFIDIVLTRRTHHMWEVLLHHVAVSGAFLHNLLTSHCIAYTVVALMAEINSFFLHSRKLMQMNGYRFDAIIYRVNAYFNLGTFIICRFGANACILYGMYIYSHRVNFIFLYCLCFSMFVMIAINSVLFSRLYSNDFLRDPQQTRKSKKDLAYDSDVAINNNGHLSDNLHQNQINGKHADHILSNGYKPKSL